MIFWGLLIAVLLSATIQGFLVLGFVSSLRHWKRPLLRNEQCPPATVILCLRGGDPFLVRCLESLRALDYPDYEILFVVDSRSDPSLSILTPMLANGWQNSHVLYLDERFETCSLKCSSLVTAIKKVRTESQFIALVDADTVPHATWLRELASALAKESIGAATGNRWYMPDRASQGAWIRHVWNAAAIVQMYWYRIAWGGTLAIKLDAIHKANLLDKWSHSLCEDTMLKKELARVGLQVEFVPSLMMINRETCTVSSFYDWVKRQLLTARLYHPLWWAVVGHGFSSAIILLAGCVSFLYSLIAGQWNEAGALFGLLASFQLYLCILLPFMERFVSDIAEARGESGRWKGNWNVWSLCRAVWETQWVYTSALITCLFMKKVEWRGVEYTISAPFEIQVHNDRPFAVSASDLQAEESL